MTRPAPTLKNWILTIVFFVAFISIILLVIKLTTVPKTPVTPERMWDVLTEQGYQPIDSTERELFENPGWGLSKSIVAEDDDMHFYFYSFDSDHSKKAVDVYAQAHSIIVRTKNAYPNVEYSSKSANYCLYYLKAKGEYNVAIYVGNTAIYAYCHEENLMKINRILQAIGYFSEK